MTRKRFSLVFRAEGQAMMAEKMSHQLV